MEYELTFEHNYKRIAEDLDVFEIEGFITNNLKHKGLLTDADVATILQGDHSKRTRAEHLLNIFKTRLQTEIRSFIEILSESYGPLVDDFNADLERIRHIDELPTTKRHIRREKKWELLHDLLKKSATFVVIHGMSGSGKTNLAVEAAMHYCLEKKGTVYWINAGGESGSLLKVLRIFLSRIESSAEDSDSQSKPEVIISKLQRVLTSDDLVILDNATPSIDFNRLKYLPTKFIVTTTDTAFRDSVDSVEYLDMSDGFSKEESLQLIAKVVKKDVKSLPEYVADIHKYFQGYPLAVALIASQLAHCPEKDWSHYCQFSDVDNGSIRRSASGLYLIENTIKTCIQSLSEEFQKYYKMLAIFKDNVFLTTDTLGVLWNCASDKKKIHSILSELEGKSLIIKNFKLALNTDAYEIHSVVLNYLRTLPTPEEIKEIHERFLQSYIDLYKDIAKFKDDFYIYYYVLYHIKSADLWDKYKSQLFTIDYIMAKLVATGPNDVQEDFKLYREELEKAGFDKTRLDETLIFSERFGWDIYNTKVKDLQFFLLLPESSLLYKEAMERCREERKLVMKNDWLTPRGNTKEYKLRGVEKIFFIDNNRFLFERKKENGKDGTIFWVKLGEMKENILSEGSILCMCHNTGQLLYRRRDETFLKQVAGNRTPVSRQFNGEGSSLWKSPSVGDDIDLKRIKLAAFSKNGKKILFVTYADKVGIYDVDKRKSKVQSKTGKEPERNPALIACCFSLIHGCDIFFVAEEKCIHIYETEKLHLIDQVFPVSSSIVDIKAVPDEKHLLIVTESTVEIMSWEHGPLFEWTRKKRTVGALSGRKIFCENDNAVSLPKRKFATAVITTNWLAVGSNVGCLVQKNPSFERRPVDCGSTELNNDFFTIEYGDVIAIDIVGETLCMISRQGQCSESNNNFIRTGPRKCVENADYSVTVHILDQERDPPVSFTDACQCWHFHEHFLAAIEGDNVVCYRNGKKVFEYTVKGPRTIQMSENGDIMVIGDKQGSIHYVQHKTKENSWEEETYRSQSKTLEPPTPVEFLRMNHSGQFIVASTTSCRERGPQLWIKSKENNMLMEKPLPGMGKEMGDLEASLIFECFFEEHDRTGKPINNIIFVYKNGAYAVYDTDREEYRLKSHERLDTSVSCAAYQNGLLLIGDGRKLHIIELITNDGQPQGQHKAKEFDHCLTTCCIDPGKKLIAVALTTENHESQIVVSSMHLEPLKTITLPYAREKLQELTFPKSFSAKKILMGRCDWLCFWDVSSLAQISTSNAPSALFSAWNVNNVTLDDDDLVARVKLQLEVQSLLPSNDFSRFAVAHKKGDRRLLKVVDYTTSSQKPTYGSSPKLNLNLKHCDKLER